MTTILASGGQGGKIPTLLPAWVTKGIPSKSELHNESLSMEVDGKEGGGGERGRRWGEEEEERMRRRQSKKRETV